jgi:hypothetical protein
MHWHVTGGHVVLAGDSAAMRVDMLDAQGWGDQGEIKVSLANHLIYIETACSV